MASIKIIVESNNGDTDHHVMPETDQLLQNWTNGNPKGYAEGCSVGLKIIVENDCLSFRRVVNVNGVDCIVEENDMDVCFGIGSNARFIGIRMIHPGGFSIGREGNGKIIFDDKEYEFEINRVLNLNNVVYFVATTGSAPSGLEDNGKLVPDYFRNFSEQEKKNWTGSLKSGDILLVTPRTNLEYPKLSDKDSYKKEYEAFAFAQDGVWKSKTTGGFGTDIPAAIQVHVFPSHCIPENPEYDAPTAILGHGKGYDEATQRFTPKKGHWSYSSSDGKQYTGFLDRIKKASGNDTEIANILCEWFNTRSAEGYINTISSIKHNVIGQLSSLDTDIQALALHVRNKDIEHLVDLFESCFKDWTEKPYTHFSPFRALMRAWFLIEEKIPENTQERIAEIRLQYENKRKIGDIGQCDPKEYNKFIQEHFSKPHLFIPSIHEGQLSLKEYLEKLFPAAFRENGSEQSKQTKQVKLLWGGIRKKLGIEPVAGEFDLLQACICLDFLFLYCYKNGYDIRNLIDDKISYFDGMKTSVFVKMIRCRIAEIGAEFNQLKELAKSKE